MFAAVLKSASFCFPSLVLVLPFEATFLLLCCERLSPRWSSSPSLAALSFLELALAPSLPRLLASSVLTLLLAIMI